ncbi:MAG: hypothetical protein PVG33_10745 [Chloroflexota bacterium]|jgi:hypothetical protein
MSLRPIIIRLNLHKHRPPALAILALALILLLLLQATAAAQDEQMELPEDYIYQQIYNPTVAGLSGLVISQNGLIYVRHLGPSQEVRVSRLDVDQNSLTRVLTLPPWAGAHGIVGGPGDSFFIEVAGQLRQVQPDGSYTVWSNGPILGLPEFYTADGRMLAIGGGGNSVVELFPDGTADTLLDGLAGVYDVIAADDGTIFISDFPAGELIRLNTDDSSSVVTPIVKDNTDLAIDRQGKLYINNAASGFARVDLDTGAKTQRFAPNAPCPVVHSPGLVLFDNNERAIFASWVDNKLAWVDFSLETGGPLISQSWANTSAAEVGADGKLYLGVTGCGTAAPSQVVRFTAAGQSEVVVNGLEGVVTGLALDESGGLYISLATETSAGTYHVPAGSSTPVLVPGTLNQDISALTVDPVSKHLFAFRGVYSQNPALVTLGEFDGEGPELQHQVAVPKTPAEFLMHFAQDGTLYAYMSEADRFAIGPVDRYILELDPAGSSYTIVGDNQRQGCCPLGGFAVDSTGTGWWLLNPDSLLYEVDEESGAALFGSNMPVDSGYANRTAAGILFLNSPEGLYKIWQPTLAERVRQLGRLVEQLVTYGELPAGPGQSLLAKVEAIAAAVERDQPNVALNLANAFLLQVRALTTSGVLTEARADSLILMLDKQILAYLP